MASLLPFCGLREGLAPRGEVSYTQPPPAPMTDPSLRDPLDAPVDAPLDAPVAPAAEPPPTEALPRPAYRPSYLFLGAVSLVTLVADLASKNWAQRRLDGVEGMLHPVDLIKDHLDFQLAHNRGGAWGILQGASEAVRKPFFLIVSVAAILFIVSLYRKLLPSQRALRWGLPLVLGGALGNLVDRIRFGWVVDFIHAHVRWGGVDHHWPTFNVADIAICIGVGLMALDMFTAHRPADASPR